MTNKEYKAKLAKKLFNLNEFVHYVGTNKSWGYCPKHKTTTKKGRKDKAKK